MPRLRLLSAFGAALIELAVAGAPYCLPGQPCFPTTGQLSAFNSSVNGRLLRPGAYASVCYAGPLYDASVCGIMVENQLSPAFRRNLPAGVMFTNYELDDRNRGCLAPSTMPSAPMNGSCTQGAMAAYSVDVRSADDVSKAVKFAAQYNLRLRVKNTGHDYTGRSSGVGSFTIWTRHLTGTSLNTAFRPAGCSTSTAKQTVIVAGSAVNGDEIFAVGAQYGVTTVGGYVPSVGVAGGYVLGGGTGPLAPAYGLGVDNVLQYEVVTADGSIKTANECQNTDLFWALRGGGGTFGVTTKVYIKAYPALQAVNAINGTLVANSTASFAALVRTWWDLQPALQAAGFSGIWEASYPLIALVLTQPFVAGAAPVALTAAAALLNNATAIPGVKNGLISKRFGHWNDAYEGIVSPTVTPTAYVGVNLIDSSRIVPVAAINDAATRARLTNFTLGLPSGVPLLFQLVGGGAVTKVDTTATAVNPAWRSAAGFFDIPVFGPATGVTAAQNATIVSVLAAADAALYAGGRPAAYYNEQGPSGAPADGAWQDLFWGDNYARLLAIKRRVDPRGVFSCRWCVGSEGGY